VESELRRSLLISLGSWTIFLTRPISAALLVLTLGVLLYPALMYARSRRRSAPARREETVETA
jgi:putative tricarboxylic transport membrane protein